MLSPVPRDYLDKRAGNPEGTSTRDFLKVRTGFESFASKGTQQVLCAVLWGVSSSVSSLVFGLGAVLRLLLSTTRRHLVEQLGALFRVLLRLCAWWHNVPVLPKNPKFS